MAAKKNISTPEKQALIMWALLVRENAGAYQSELKPKTEKRDRDALKEKDLITWWKSGGRKIWIEVTDKGWDWAGKNLSAPLPASPATPKIFEAWLAKLEVFIHARGLSLADVLGPQNVSPLNGASQRELAEPAVEVVSVEPVYASKSASGIVRAHS